MKKSGHKKIHDPDARFYREDYPHVHEAEMNCYVRQFNANIPTVLNMPPLLDAVAGVRRLVDKGFKFHAITAMGVELDLWKARKECLDRTFGTDVFVELTLTEFHHPESKRETLERYKDSGLFFIEDTPWNIMLGRELGLKSIFMMADRRIQPEFPDDVHMVNDWKQVCDIILSPK